MAQMILSKGKNVSEAIESGLSILGVGKESVTIEVIQQESKGLFRIKPAVVKLTVNSGAAAKEQEPLPPVETIESLIENIDVESNIAERKMKNDPEYSSFKNPDLDGKAWVKDGKIHIQPCDLMYPTISVGKGVTLFKNKEKINGTTVVSREDRFDIQVMEDKSETKWNVTIDKSKVHAILHIEPGRIIHRKVKDLMPDVHIELQVEEHYVIQNDIGYKDILEKLESLNITQGLNHQEIMSAVNTKETADFVIASGVKPQEGKNGFLQIVADVKGKDNGPAVRPDGTIDFREMKFFPTVNQGQVIGIIVPPVPGIPGRTVTHELIPAKEVYPILIQPGKGIALIENSTKIVATETGRPIIEKNGNLTKVSILQKLIHTGDVDMSTGNIRFKGDIDIFGNVQENMHVEADGHVMIAKNTNLATVISKSSIVIHQNAISSFLSSGHNNYLLSELIHTLDLIQIQVEKFLLSIEQLLKEPAFKLTDHQQKGLHPLIKLLSEIKFRNLPNLITQYIELCEREKQMLQSEFSNLAEQLRLSFLSSVPNQWHTSEQLKHLYKTINELINKNRSYNDEDCSIDLKYALNSSIYCSGNVTIKGQGCYNTKIHSGGHLNVNGVLRGGEVYARLGAYIKESGSEGGIITHIIVPNDKKIKIESAREGTIIQFGNIKKKLNEHIKNMEASLDSNGKIIY
ncbi:hypothetical protein BIV59_15540 [Bacillus sp. MUM 13]|nr:hypothetical protein BIV59_15540 [Bacillus sp. MUM 13]